jgi:Fic family protein
VDGVVDVVLDATRNFDQALSAERLFGWHAALFPTGYSGRMRITVAAWRTDAGGPMDVVSGAVGRETVHFTAPPADTLAVQTDAFLQWFNAAPVGDALIKAGLAHLWLVTLHPFDDGNGRLTRSLTDLALAQAQPQATRFHALSASILADRSGYYRSLETTQKGSLDITGWLRWFLTTLHDSLVQALHRIDRVLAKARFWQQHQAQPLSAEQVKVLNRLLDGGERGFEHGISASQYQAVAKVSKATATRHLADLLEKGCLRRLPGSGRSTRYAINTPASSIALPTRTPSRDNTTP